MASPGPSIAGRDASDDSDDARDVGVVARHEAGSAVWRNWLGFFLLGTINNMPYVIINSSANTIAKSFSQENNVAMIPWANVAFGFAAKCLNTFVFIPLGVPYSVRIFFNGILMLAGLIGVAFAPNFWVAIGAVIVSGATAGFGENVILGYLRLYNPSLITAWSSGTGMAGILGAGLYIGLACAVKTPTSDTHRYQTLRHMNNYVFLLSTPIVIVYWLAYFFILVKPAALSLHREARESGRYKASETSGLIQAESASASSDEELVPREGSCARLGRCLRQSAWLSFNLGLVYFAEYIARSCSAKSKYKTDPIYTPVCPEFYAAIQLCYQAGVFVSRSSLSLVKVKRVGVLTLLQVVNMVVWIFIAWKHFAPIYILPAYMVFVGLLGGGSYVNVFYLLRTDPSIRDEDREYCLNVVGLTISLGIFFGTGFNTALFHLPGFKDQ